MKLAQAMESEEKHEYKKSIVVFLSDLELLNAFQVVSNRPDANICGSRWLCTKNYDSNGNLLKYKSRSTPLGYQHK